MSDPTIDPSILSKAADWIWAGVIGLVGIIYKSNEKKLEALAATIDHEVRCARIEIKGKADSEDVKKALGHIEKLFDNAEQDRKIMRDFHDKAMEAQRGQYDNLVKMMAAEGGRRK